MELENLSITTIVKETEQQGQLESKSSKVSCSCEGSLSFLPHILKISATLLALTGQMISIIVHYCKYHRFTLIITHLLLLAQDLLSFCCFFLLALILVLRFFRWEYSCHHMKELLLNSDAASKNKSSILLILLFIQL